jgi:hypothetical protein
MATPNDEDQRSFAELTSQVALGRGFQLLVVIVDGPVDPEAFVDRLSADAAAMRGAFIDHAVLDPFIAVEADELLTLQELERWILSPLLHSPLLGRCIDPLIAIDMTSVELEDRYQEGLWEHYLLFVNRQRNALTRAFAGTLLLLITDELAVMLARAAPDLWSIRSGVVWIRNALSLNAELAPPRGLLAKQVQLRRSLRHTGPDPASLEALTDDLFEPSRSGFRGSLRVHHDKIGELITSAFSRDEFAYLLESGGFEVIPEIDQWPNLTSTIGRIEAHGELLRLFRLLTTYRPQLAPQLRRVIPDLDLDPHSDDLAVQITKLPEPAFNRLCERLGVSVLRTRSARGNRPHQARLIVDLMSRTGKLGELREVLDQLNRSG